MLLALVHTLPQYTVRNVNVVQNCLKFATIASYFQSQLEVTTLQKFKNLLLTAPFFT